MSTIEDKAAAGVAKAVRSRRESRGWTLRALAERSGVSSSMLSDIERAAKSPTVSTLAAIAQALGVPLATLVDGTAPERERLRVVRAGDRAVSVDPASGARREGFGPALAGSRVEFLRYVVPPGMAAGPFAAHPAGTIEHLHLAAGAIRFTLGDDAVTLSAGDSCSCLADAPHGFDNRDGVSEARIYLVVEAS